MTKYGPKKESEKSAKNCQDIKIGISIRQMREEMGLSGAALCRRSGGKLDPKTLTALEKGRIKNPSMATLQALAKGFGMTVSGLFRQMEMQKQSHFSQGSQKGIYKIDFHAKGVQLVSFTPLNETMFCGKVILEGHKGFDEKLLGYAEKFFIMVLVGQVEADIESKKVSLKEGENFFLNGGMKFCMTNPLQRHTTLLLVTVPSCL